MSFKVSTLIRYRTNSRPRLKKLARHVVHTKLCNMFCSFAERYSIVLMVVAMRINILSLMAANMSLRRMILTGLQHTVAFVLGKLRLSQPFARWHFEITLKSKIGFDFLDLSCPASVQPRLYRLFCRSKFWMALRLNYLVICVVPCERVDNSSRTV